MAMPAVGESQANALATVAVGFAGETGGDDETEGLVELQSAGVFGGGEHEGVGAEFGENVLDEFSADALAM